MATLHLQYIPDIQFALQFCSVVGRGPSDEIICLPPSKRQLLKEQHYFINANSLHFTAKKRILEVSVVNKNEAWIKKYAESTGNLNRRIKKIKKISLRIRHKELILQLQ